MGSFQKFCLRWNNHSSNFVGNLGLILASEEYSDVTVCCQGEVWHLHQLVLSASSSHFAQLLRLTPPGKTPILILDGPPANDVNALIHFIYHGEVNVDQESLPSLLRTAASLRIKGLADVTGLTQEINSESFPADEEIPALNASLITCGTSPSNVGAEDMSPLNLSCNKNQDLKEEHLIKEENYSRHVVPNVDINQDTELKGNVRNESESFFHPPTKRVRTVESQSIAGPTAASLISPTDSQSVVNETVYIPGLNSQIKCKHNICTLNEKLDSCTLKKEVISQKLLLSQKQPLEKIRVIPSKGPATFYNGTVNTSMPLLNMAISPHVAYQQSSTTQTSLEIIQSENNNIGDVVVPITNVCNLSPTSDSYSCKTAGITNADQSHVLHENIRLQPAQDVTSSVAILSSHNLPISSVDVCSSSCSDQEKAKEEKVANQSFPISSSEVGGSSPTRVEEKTFNHKKFSPCIIPSSNISKKTIQVISNVYTSNPAAPPYVIKNESANDSFPTSNESHASSSVPPEILIQSPSVVKLTPVAVSNYSPIMNVNNSFPTNSIIYTASASSAAFKPCENTGPVAPVNTVLPIPKINVTHGEDKTNAFVQSNPSPQETTEAADNNAFNSSSVSFPATSVAHSTEGVTQNTQRVTINMRTFKEEWRRQLLVDYDSRTNMSICMLCFTTFKSYDGPRKNTYVKHAKRFHPALEDYSDEERGVIISMYEKYHKYDIDMQKEINKSFRTTNSSSSSLKRIKASDAGLPIHINPGLANRVDTEGESSEEKGDSGTEGKFQDNAVGASRDSDILEDTSAAHSSENEGMQDPEISNNNNKHINDKNSKRKSEPQRDTLISL